MLSSLSTKTLSLLLARRFLQCSFVSIGVFTLIIDIFDFSDMLRKWPSRPFYALQLTLTHTPDHLMVMLPFALFIATMGYFYFLNKNKELTILSGQGLAPFSCVTYPAIISFVLGLFIVLITPSITSKSENLNDTFLSNNGTSLWARQNSVENEQLVFHLEHAQLTSQNGCQSKVLTVQTLTIYTLSKNGELRSRITSPNALLCKNKWEINNPSEFNGLGVSTPISKLTLPSILTPEQIAATSLSFNVFPLWKLSPFIAKLQIAGINTLKYKIYFQGLLALPFFCTIMTLIAALGISATPVAKPLSIFFLIELGIGFGLYALVHVSEQLAKMGLVSPFVSAWAPLIMLSGFIAYLSLHRTSR